MPRREGEAPMKQSKEDIIGYYLGPERGELSEMDVPFSPWVWDRFHSFEREENMIIIPT